MWSVKTILSKCVCLPADPKILLKKGLDFILMEGLFKTEIKKNGNHYWIPTSTKIKLYKWPNWNYSAQANVFLFFYENRPFLPSWFNWMEEIHQRELGLFQTQVAAVRMHSARWATWIHTQANIQLNTSTA